MNRALLLLLIGLIFYSCSEDNGPVDPGGSSSFRADALKVLEELNKIRTNPRSYIALIQQVYDSYDGNSITYPNGDKFQARDLPAYPEAIEYLQNQQAIGALSFSEEFAKAAEAHCNFQGENGQVGHTGKNGSSPFDRMREYADYNTAGENISYGHLNAVNIIIQLVVDADVPDRGHRVNIFNAGFGTVGIGMGTHPVYSYMCVMDFADQTLPKSNILVENKNGSVAEKHSYDLSI